ncbi:MAG TPA: SRPBCC family protein [Pyrinomonadaceae bacterium]|jgi:ligand-binding SRPBCC domain-containing protein|nr:SRPBCC family protein [Pyrinomonadaceae bacterium]
MQFVKVSVIRASPELVFAFHEQPDVLSLLIPPWERARVIQAAKISDLGAQAIIETKMIGPITARWIAQHTVYDPPRLFEDVQVTGPFRSWRHRHIVDAHRQGAELRDEIDYEPPLGFLGRALAPVVVERRLRKLFDYRHEVTRRWCEQKQDER